MKLMVSFILLALISQTYAAKKSSKHKKSEKNDKREYQENNYGDRIESKGHSKYEDNDSEEDLSERQHEYSPHHYTKISDVLTDGHYHDAIASHLYSPISPYQHRFHVPGYEISSPIASELAYSAHETHMPSYSKKYKKKGQPKHNYHEEDVPKDHYYSHSYPHLANYPHDYVLRNVYSHIPQHVYAQRAFVSPHLYHGGAAHLYTGVSPLIRPIVPSVLGHQVIPQVGLTQPLAYANGALAYSQGYVQPVQYIQQQAVGQVIPNTAYGQEGQVNSHESQGENNAQATSAGAAQQAVQQQQQVQQLPQHYQQTQIQPQQAQSQVHQPVQYQQHQLQPQLIQSQPAQQQLENVQVQPQQLQNVQPQSRHSQGAVSYASFSQSLPLDYSQHQAFTQTHNQPTQAVPPQLTLSNRYKVETENEPKPQPKFQILVDPTAQQSQQVIPNLKFVQAFHTTPLPSLQSTQNMHNHGYLPPRNNEELEIEESQSQVQIETSEPHLQTLQQLSRTQEATASVEPILQQAEAYSESMVTSTPNPKKEHTSSNKELSDTDKDIALLRNLSDAESTTFSELLNQHSGVPGADVQYFGNYARTLLRNFQH